MNSGIEPILTDLLNHARELIESDHAEEALALLGNTVNAHPEIADKRFGAELGLLEGLISCRKTLKESEHVRSYELVSKYCRMVYARDENPDSNSLPGEELPDKDKVWWFWMQGANNAPEIVKKCLASLGRLNKEIIILDENNISEYVSMPGYIMDLYRSGVFSTTHFSDLLRLELLTRRGGMWIDSTVFCSSPDTLLDIVSSSDLFAYRAIRADNISRYATYDSWLIYSSKPSYILEDTKRMIFEYWKKEDRLQHYFLFHIFMNIACEMHRDEESLIPVFSSEPCHILQMEMLRQHNAHRLEQILSMSGIHKLTYKYDTAGEIRGTYLDRILNDSI